VGGDRYPSPERWVTACSACSAEQKPHNSITIAKRNDICTTYDLIDGEGIYLKIILINTRDVIHHPVANELHLEPSFVDNVWYWKVQVPEVVLRQEKSDFNY